MTRHVIVAVALIWTESADTGLSQGLKSKLRLLIDTAFGDI